MGGSQQPVDDDTPDPKICKTTNAFDGTDAIADELLPDWGDRQQIKHVDARALKAYELRCARGIHPALGAEGNALGAMKQVVRVISLLDGGQPGQVCTPISVRKILQIEIAVVHVSRAG